MKTALELLNSQNKGYLMLGREEFAKVMIKFAKAHCKAQLEAILENAKVSAWSDQDGVYGELEEDSIKNSYPLTQIV